MKRRDHWLRAAGVLLALPFVMAPQTFTPTPPPKLPKVLSKEKVEKGKALFEENVFRLGPLEIYHFLGKGSCGGCHNQTTKLSGEALARKFGSLPFRINEEIRTKMGGDPLPPDGPTMEALVQYMSQKYRLRDYKILD